MDKLFVNDVYINTLALQMLLLNKQSGTHLKSGINFNAI